MAGKKGADAAAAADDDDDDDADDDDDDDGMVDTERFLEQKYVEVIFVCEEDIGSARKQIHMKNEGYRTGFQRLF